MNILTRFQVFLGPARVRALIVLLGATGLLSLMLNAVEGADWVPVVQNGLVLVFIVGAAVIIGGRMDRPARLRWLAVLAPAFGLVVLGTLFFPDQLLLFMGGAFGWTVAGLFMFQGGSAPQEYKLAIRHMRKGRYAEAVDVIDGLIKQHPDKPEHYRLRAELLRLWGKLGRARRDYDKMIQLDPESAVAYNGLAEVCLQAGDYQKAREAGFKAYELAPDEWVAPYNLGMIEDRLGLSEAVIEHLDQALALKVPDARHRLLIQLYRVRAYSRLKELESAQAALEQLRGEQGGLEDWQVILESDQATTLRDVLQADVDQARQLIDGEIEVDAIGRPMS